MYYINTIQQLLSTAKTYEHNLLDERSIVDRHQCLMAAKFGVCVDEDRASYLNCIKDPKGHVLLLILAHVPLRSCL